MTTNGVEFIVDDDWAEDVSGVTWHCDHNSYIYARSFEIDRRKSRRLLHRIITGALVGEVVDHKNMNPLDNRRDNLRICTRAENNRNSRKRRTNTSGYKGVFREGNRWYAAITTNYEKKRLGCFATPEEAAKVYDAEIFKHHGQFARPNE